MAAATQSNQVVIPASATTSGAYKVGASVEATGGICGFVMPAAFTGASISFQVSVDDTTYQVLQDNTDTLVSITVTQAKTYALKQDIRSLLAPWQYIKIVSASTEGAARTIIVVTKA